MNQRDVEHIVRGVLRELAAPFAVLSVARMSTGWYARLKPAQYSRVLTLRLPEGPPPAIRSATMRGIETDLDTDA